jgi:glycosyltransferase 2 family protein
MRKYKLGMLLLSFVILGAVLLLFNPFVIADLLSKADASLILLAFLLSFLVTCMGVLKWKVLLKNIPYTKVFPVQVLGYMISNFTPGKAAEPAKAVILKMRTKTPISFSLASIIWERVMDVIVLLIFSAVVIANIPTTSNLFLPSILGVGIFLGIAGISLLVLFFERFGDMIFSVVKRLPLFNRLPPNFMKLFYAQQISRKRLLTSFFVSLVAWIATGITLYVVLLAFGVTVNPMIAVGIVALSIVVGIASSLPGGLGTTELVMIFLLGTAGVDASIAAAATLTFRLATIWFVDLLGGISFVYLSRKIELKNLFR